MHRLFREALENATGESRRIIVVFIDIRGFSSFSHRCESVDVASFIRKVYMKIIDIYFPFSSFFKSTGDGLLLTVPWEDENLQEISQKVIDSCIKCHSEFGTLFDDDPSINFDVPRKIGIGVARGSACCLVSGDKIIDYSGRLLNLAARLTDIARPSGIVIDEAFVIDLLTDEQREIFEEDNIYLKGIHEKEPVKVYFTPEFTEIPRYNKEPIVSKRWREEAHVKLFRDLSKLGKFEYYLKSEPLSPDYVVVNIKHDKIINGEVHPEYYSTFDFREFNYKLKRGKPLVTVDFPALCKRLEQEGVKEEMKVAITVAYVEK